MSSSIWLVPSSVWVGEVWSKHGLKWLQECAFTCWRPISPLWFLRNSAIGCKWGKLAPLLFIYLLFIFTGYQTFVTGKILVFIDVYIINTIVAGTNLEKREKKSSRITVHWRKTSVGELKEASIELSDEVDKEEQRRLFLAISKRWNPSAEKKQVLTVSYFTATLALLAHGWPHQKKT